MKKIIRFSYLLLLSGLFLSSCNSAAQKTTEYNFSFNCVNCTINGHEGESIIKVLKNKTDIEFTVVAKKDYILPSTITGTSDNVHYNQDNGVIKIDKMVNNVNVTVTATNFIDHIVKFDSDGGTPVLDQRVQDGKLLTEPVVTKEGEKFVGWYRDRNKFDFTTPITEDNITLTAHWDDSKYEVNWKSEDVLIEHDFNVTYGSKPSFDGETPTKPSKFYEDYEFIGWEPAITSDTIVDGNQTYNAVFASKVRKYDVKWWLESIDGTLLQSEKAKYGSKVPFKGDNPVRKAEDEGKHGFIFKGWDPDPLFATVYSDIDFVAQWDDTYLIVFKNYDGSIICSNYVKAGDRPTAPKAPIKPGDKTHKYVFAGWDDEKYSSDNLPPVDSYHEYVAKFDEVTQENCRVEFNIQNGVMYENDFQNIAKGEKVIKPFKDPYRAGYSFLGWYDATGINQFDFSESIYDDVEIFAKWEEDNNFKTPFYYENSSGSENSVLVNDNMLYKTSLSNEWQIGSNKNIKFTNKLYLAKNGSHYFDKNNMHKPTRKYNVGGNIMSLCESDENKFPFMNEVGNSQFSSLFDGETNLTSAENLLLPATSLHEEAYDNMFYNCSNLKKSPKLLPAPVIGLLDYYFMFYNCNSLEKSPFISAIDCENNGLTSMFAKCSSLTEVTVGFGNKDQTEWPFDAVNSLGWLDSVNSNGTFIWNGPTTGFTSEFYSINTVPVGWNIENPS